MEIIINIARIVCIMIMIYVFIIYIIVWYVRVYVINIITVVGLKKRGNSNDTRESVRVYHDHIVFNNHTYVRC